MKVGFITVHAEDTFGDNNDLLIRIVILEINRCNWDKSLWRYRIHFADDNLIPSIKLACTSLSARINV